MEEKTACQIPKTGLLLFVSGGKWRKVPRKPIKVEEKAKD
ncbi:MAG: hypothetical protein IJZ44_09130 [Lachnospiraceae bacterium]|nr:hypothetical protein [Lachnospiraceae bacterium]